MLFKLALYSWKFINKWSRNIFFFIFSELNKLNSNIILVCEYFSSSFFFVSSSDTFLSEFQQKKRVERGRPKEEIGDAKKKVYSRNKKCREESGKIGAQRGNNGAIAMTVGK